MFGYIYKTTDKFTNKIYIGKHHSDTFKGIDYIGSGLIIRNIKNKCLKENISLENRFLVELIDVADSLEELNEKEKFWIETLDARNPDIGYNIRAGGDCGPGGAMFKGHKHSEETKLKMSLSRKGSNNSNFGNRWVQSKELRELHSKLSSGENNGMFGKKHSDISKQKNSESHKGKIAISNIEKDIVKMIYIDELEMYLNLGWVKGNIHTHRDIK